eukprot:TRINITY_DN6067_c0_g1_i6.p1 TRINITY_DN6067_c0_g1~~TRINITY_DN6067_c0_g1_i6.p1  ORF type:complete len:224 (-),score=54.86 TRINITY_DN6067_c0_g1_i6:85-696(-)
MCIRDRYMGERVVRTNTDLLAGLLQVEEAKKPEGDRHPYFFRKINRFVGRSDFAGFVSSDAAYFDDYVTRLSASYFEAELNEIHFLLDEDQNIIGLENVYRSAVNRTIGCHRYAPGANPDSKLRVSLKLKPGERLSEVSGTFENDAISSITIATSKGRKFSVGQASANAFPNLISTGFGVVIRGIAGSFGQRLESIYVYFSNV